MSNDKPAKQKNIDDVLSSIDSLLDTATDASLDDVGSSTTKTTSKPKPNQTTKTTESATKQPKTVAKRPPASKKQVNKPKQSQQTKADQTAPNKVKSADDNQHGKRQSGTVKKTAVNTAKEASAVASDLDNNAASDMAENAKDKEAQVDQVQLEKSPVRNTDPDNHLNFTTVDDDLSQAMRELPVLDDIVSEQDLALIGSGKEPPKKVLTEAFKRLSLTDKLIEILENQLSDYDISKLEYKYLHELFEELIEKEKSKSE